VGDNADDRGEFFDAHLPDMQVGNFGIAVIFDAFRITTGKSELAGIRSRRIELLSRRSVARKSETRPKII
jgi:hypothetical protein